MDFTITALRSMLAFFALLLLTRLMGKKQISQLTLFDYITGITIGNIAAALSVEGSVSIVEGLTGIVIWSALTIFMGFLAVDSMPTRKIIEGEPTVVIQHGKILEQNMAKMNYDLHNLLMQLRNKGVFDPSEVEFAFLEPNGQLSVLKKAKYQPATPKDLNIPTGYKGIASKLVIDGEVIEENLTKNGLSYQWLKEQLRLQGINDLHEVTLVTLNTDGTLYVDKREDTGAKQRLIH